MRRRATRQIDQYEIALVEMNRGGEADGLQQLVTSR